jgi:hypothetical protein
MEVIRVMKYLQNVGCRKYGKNFLVTLFFCSCLSFFQDVCYGNVNDNGSNQPSFISRFKNSFVKKMNGIFRKEKRNKEEMYLPETFIVNSDAHLKELMAKIRKHMKKRPIKVILKEKS